MQSTASTRSPAATGTTLTSDYRGNVTYDGTRTFAYSSENLLTADSNGASLKYDPLGRLHEVTLGSATTRFGYDGLAMISEHNGSNVLQKRHVHGQGMDEPVATYNGATMGLTTRLYPHQDERGSVIALFNADGTVNAINKYDEYGVPASTNAGRFGYTGQVWLPEVGLYYYKARMYDPKLGRFLQPDPLGYADGMNGYGGMRGDPVNLTDPSGTCVQPGQNPSAAVIAEHSQCMMMNAMANAAYSTHLSNEMAGWAIGKIEEGEANRNLLLGQDLMREIAAYHEAEDMVDSQSSALENLTAGQGNPCLVEPNCGGDIPLETARLILRLMDDSDVREAMVNAWAMSLSGHGSRQGVHEHGFWIAEAGNNFTPLQMRHGFGTHIRRGYNYGASIWFQTHPFSGSGFSRDDINNSKFHRSFSVIMSHAGFYYNDFRR